LHDRLRKERLLIPDGNDDRDQWTGAA
jgi:hypothetical protein